MTNDKKILIAIPSMDYVASGFAGSLATLAKVGECKISFICSSLIYDARNKLAAQAIESEADYILWLDSDMTWPVETITILMHDIQKLDAHMVTGLYVKRSFPTEPVLYKVIAEPVRKENGLLERNIEPYTDFPRNVSAFPVAGCGFGCCLTSVKLLKDVWDHFGPAFAPYTWAGEDISFCHRVNQLGYTIYCDTDVSCGHIGTYEFTVNDLQRGSEED